MRIRMDKNEFLKIERAVLYLEENPQSEQAIADIQDAFNNCFGIETQISVIDPPPNSPWFIMSVYPDKSTVDKVIDAVMSDKDHKTIQKLWQQTKVWTIEIDQRIFGRNPKFTEKELTAMMLHEVGHIAISNSITRRISNIMRYKIAMANMENKALLKDSIFKKVLSLPILNACIANNKSNNDSVKEEIKADSFVKKAGYQRDLVSALKKMIPKTEKNNADKDMADLTGFTVNTIEQFKQRKDNLVKEYVEAMINTIDSPYLKESVADAYEFILHNNIYTESTLGNRVSEYYHDRADSVVTESFGIFRTKLPRLNASDLDYVDMKTLECKNVDDKMMLVSFCRSKIDMIDYYIRIVSDPDLARKYRCPQSLPELQQMKNRYENSIERIKNFKLPVYAPGMMIKWADGYEG